PVPAQPRPAVGPQRFPERNLSVQRTYAPNMGRTSVRANQLPFINLLETRCC
ncbi:hypothetical protein Nmel_000145, partial [Mimus melanotis]